MLSKFKQFFYNPVCLNCGSYFTNDHLCCETCFSHHIEPYLNLKINKFEEQFDHAFLLDWFPGESDLISEMVYRFKSDHCTKAWAFYANYLAEALSGQMDLSCFDALVPIPGSKQTSVHAQIFAQNLSSCLGIPVFAALTQVKTNQFSAVPQKTKNARERRLSVGAPTVKRLEQFTKEETANLNLIYVDDIMTTGSTYKRAQEAVGNKNKSMLVTLFYRPKQL